MDLRGKKVTIVGLGRTAVALARLLLREGATPFVTDAAAGEKYARACADLDALGVHWECGGHTAGAFEGAALVIPSPGVPPAIAPIAAARAAGAAVLGEMELASRYCRSRVLAVTGTNGKTTTTELLRTLVAACGRSVLLAGNNDFPFSAAVMAHPAPEYIVLEVSSYQLETALTFRPWIGAVLNLTPDHLARHATMDEYARVKARLFANQQDGDIAVVNHDDLFTAAMAASAPARTWRFSLAGRVAPGLWVNGDTILEGDAPVAAAADLRLPGRHNLANALAALTMMRAGGFDWPRVLEGLRSFRGVEHRIEHVARIGGADFYNDSKSTNVDSLKVALESFDAPIVLIAGGEGKGADYRVLRDLVQRHVKALVTLGQDAPLLEAAFGDLVNACRVEHMDAAVAAAAQVATPGDVVLLSPACASFDMFDNFEHRGRVFKESVAKYQRGESI